MEIGSLVQLISGGPILTVNAVHETGMLCCSWFNQVGEREYEYQEAWLSPKALIARD